MKICTMQLKTLFKLIITYLNCSCKDNIGCHRNFSIAHSNCEHIKIKKAVTLVKNLTYFVVF